MSRSDDLLGNSSHVDKSHWIVSGSSGEKNKNGNTGETKSIVPLIWSSELTLIQLGCRYRPLFSEARKRRLRASLRCGERNTLNKYIGAPITLTQNIGLNELENDIFFVREGSW